MAQEALEVQVDIVGTTPLLMHADNIEWADTMEAWKNDPDNKKRSKAGDDRTPPYRWIGYLYSSDETNGSVMIPADYVMSCIRGGAAGVPTGKGQKTFKSQSQSGILIQELGWPLTVDGRTIKMADIQKLKHKTFKEQADGVKDLGFLLYVKRAPVGASKHIRVRPIFNHWATSGRLVVGDDSITLNVLQRILDIAGREKGLGDWRPGSKTPGPYGTFTAKVSKV